MHLISTKLEYPLLPFIKFKENENYERNLKREKHIIIVGLIFYFLCTKICACIWPLTTNNLQCNAISYIKM